MDIEQSSENIAIFSHKYKHHEQHIEDLTLVDISYEIYETSLRRVS